MNKSKIQSKRDYKKRAEALKFMTQFSDKIKELSFNDPDYTEKFEALNKEYMDAYNNCFKTI